MKKFVLFLFLFVASFCYGQNWNCFVPGVKQYFINGDGYLKGIRIDSVRTIGSNTVYYPFHTPRGMNYDSVRLDTTAGSWVGKKVISDVNGVFYFDNLFGDTVVIKTFKDTGSWVFYKSKDDTTGLYYMATVMSKDTMTIGSVLDSVKQINIQAYRYSSLVADSANKLTLLLSKNFGFVKAFEIYLFPYHAANSTIKLYGELDYYFDGYASSFTAPQMMFDLVKYYSPIDSFIYNFVPGDKFKWYGMGDILSPRLFCTENETLTIVSKNVTSTETDYAIKYWDETKCSTSTPPYNDMIDSVGHPIQANGSSLVDLGKMPEEWGVKQVYYYKPNDSSFCYKSPLYEMWTNFIGANGTVYTFEPCPSYTKYKAGLGMIESYQCYDAPGGADYTKTMTGARKNGIDCGLGVEPMKINGANVIEVYPNPANDEVTIKFEGNINELQIDVLNMLGQTVLSANTKGQQYSFNIKNLPNGMYEVRVGDGKVWSHQKLVIQH